MGTPTAPTPPTQTRQTPDSLRALERCVGDPGEFIDNRFTVAPHSHHTGGFADLLSLDDVDGQIAGGGLRTPAVRLVRDGEVLDPAGWTRRARTGGVWVDDLVHPGRVLEAFAGGATVVLQSLQRWWPPLAAFCRDLEETLEHPVQANAYLTPAGARGLAPHHDTHDVFVLQVEGAKSWTVRRPLIDAPLARHRSDHRHAGAQPVLFETDLRPGDCMYLPRGFVHSASAQAGTSLHVTIGVLATTVHDLVRQVVSRAADEARFRRALPVGYASDPALAAQVVRDALADMAEWLAKVDPEPVAAAAARRFWSARTPSLAGHLVDLSRLDAIADDTVVRRRPATGCRVEEGDGGVTVVLGDRRLVMPAGLAEPVRRLADGAEHRVGDLADLADAGSRVVLVRRLVREGLLQTVVPAGGRGG